MPFHLPANKPRSLHRQLSAYSSPCTIQGPIPPSLEQSLDEWLSRTSSNNSVSSDVSNDLGLYGSSYSQCLAQSSMSTSPTNNTYSSEHQQQQPVYPCLCCQLPQCAAWKKIIKITCKLETETRLAAVGQSLLQTNETYKIESDKLQEQVKRCQEQNQALEISLNDAERLTRQLTLEKDKWKWQYEKSQKILNESAADLESANSKCTSLTKDIEESKLEMDKLQRLKIKSYQFGTRQDILESKLQDLKQELVISRKDKVVIESKYKKLTTQFETLSCAYQEMCKEASNRKLGKEFAKPLSSITPPSTIDIAHADTDELAAFVKELVSTNNGLKSELLSTSTQLNHLRHEMNSRVEKSPQYNNISPKNIGGTHNNGLLLDKHISSLGKKVATSNSLGRRTANGDGRSNGQKLTTARTTSATLNSKTRHRSASVRVSRSKSTREIRTPLSSTNDTTVRPQTTTSSPVVHHHYHYYTDVRQQNISNTNKNVDVSNSNLMTNMNTAFSAFGDNKIDMFAIEGNPAPKNGLTTTTPTKTTSDIHHQPATLQHEQLPLDMDQHSSSDSPKLVLSSTVPVESSLLTSSPSKEDKSTMTIITKGPTTHYTTLLHQAKSILHRIHATDTRTINRRLQRAYDIGELSNMSNSLLQNIMADVDTIYARYFWVSPDENDDDDEDGDKDNKNEFSDTVRLLQELLQEIAQLSVTINHLQVAYVKKVQENETQIDRQHSDPTSPSILMISSHDGDNNTTSTDDPTPLPSLLPSGNTSYISSTKSLASFTEHNSTTTSLSLTVGTGDDDSSQTNGQQEERHIRCRQPDLTQAHYRHRQQHRPSFSSPGHYNNNNNKIQFWSSISFMMDAWNHMLPMENASSSYLDREWRWSCSEVAQ
ncbi:unnamed protein product [Absidia cylindrospora]